MARTGDERAARQAQAGAMSFTQTQRDLQHKGFDQPDEVREFPNGRAEILEIGGGSVGRFVFQPGWRWSDHVKPLAGTQSCEVQHFQYQVSGRLCVRMDDGTEFISGPGDVLSIPSGHDGWVVGDEPAVVIDFHGASTYATPA
jgi:quercetin dioxygenase-like cupin family protein